MTQNQNLNEELHIEEILLEAHAFGLDHEVDEWAKKLLKKNPKMSKVDAYQEAYNEWIK
jgi:hypothetical protein